MHPDTWTTINRVRKSRFAKKAAVATLTIVTYSIVMNRYGYKMVRPERITASGEVVFVTVTGKLMQPSFA